MQEWTSAADDGKDGMVQVHGCDGELVVGDKPLEPPTWVRMQYDDRRNDR